VILPLHAQRFDLPLVGALIQCLDSDRKPITGAFASGFVRRESEGLFLYTCWHVVTGFNPYDVQVGHTLPERRFLQVALQAANTRQPGIEVIGGLQTVVVPLYESESVPLKPRWRQDDLHVSHPDLNAVGLHVPFWHDAVKLRLPPETIVAEGQIIDESRLFLSNMPLLTPGDKCLIVGFPYGFSAFGPRNPTPIVLTRFVASMWIEHRPQQLLLESIAAPGMSGGPVYVEREGALLLFGIYTGVIFPDGPRQRGEREKLTDLGVVTNLSLILWGKLHFVSEPSIGRSVRVDGRGMVR
jgi:hypothetical protein